MRPATSLTTSSEASSAPHSSVVMETGLGHTDASGPLSSSELSPREQTLCGKHPGERYDGSSTLHTSFRQGAEAQTASSAKVSEKIAAPPDGPCQPMASLFPAEEKRRAPTALDPPSWNPAAVGVSVSTGESALGVNKRVGCNVP
eukprot:scaffold45373_cov208-Isochrysis_galbana.AAC.2